MFVEYFPGRRFRFPDEQNQRRNRKTTTEKNARTSQPYTAKSVPILYTRYAAPARVADNTKKSDI